MAFLVAILAACTTYSPLPLPSGPDSADAIPTKPLTMLDVATLAVERNPDLVASRRKAEVARAQSFAAGLLPDPQLNLSVDHPSAPGFVNGYLIGLSEDLQTLLTHPARAAAARAAADQAKLSSAWDEWQTIEKACTLFVQKSIFEAKAAVLARTASILRQQSDHSTKALATHDVTVDQAGADLAASLDVLSLQNSAQRDVLTAESSLNALLDLDPSAHLALTDLGQLRAYQENEFRAALANIAKTRPDLLALQAGYASQEESVWVAVLSQFPSVSLGVNRAADTSNVHTTGLGVTINLPIFNGARGDIRVQTATRAQLHAEYQARIDQTTADAWRLWKEVGLLEAQIAERQKAMPAFRQMAASAARAYNNHDLAPATFVLMQNTLSTREGELFDLQISLWTDVIALHTLLADPYVRQPDAVP